MATLAAVNDTLLEVSDNTKETSKGITAFIEYIEGEKAKNLEAEREAKALAKKLDKAEEKNNKSTGSGGGGFLSNLSPSKLLAGGGLLSLGALTGSALLRRLPGLGLIGFADTIALFFC